MAAAPPALLARAPWVLGELAAVTGRRARLGVLQQLDVAYIQKHPTLRPVSAFRSAATLPAHPTALGRALLAFASAGTVEMTIMRGLRAYTAHTVTAPDLFRRAPPVARLRRVAVTRFKLELKGCGVAVPVLGPGGGVVAAVELALPATGRELQPAIGLSIATRSLSRELAGGGWNAADSRGPLGRHHRCRRVGPPGRRMNRSPPIAGGSAALL